jgi:hypothetical protein
MGWTLISISTINIFSSYKGRQYICDLSLILFFVHQKTIQKQESGEQKNIYTESTNHRVGKEFLEIFYNRLEIHIYSRWENFN